MTQQEQNEYNASRGLATVESGALERMADDGCPHHEPLPRRPFVGLRQRKKEARDRRTYYPTSVGTLVELEDGCGVYGEAGRSPELWQKENVKDDRGNLVGRILVVYIDAK